MRSFYISLFIFIVLMCSCKTKEVARKIDSNERITSDSSVVFDKIEIDTTKTEKIEQTEEYTRIIERETVTEYDTEKQTISKVTEKEKISEQGKQTKTDESQDRGITSVQKDSTDHFLDITKKEDVQEDVKEESVVKGLFDNLGKWLGIGIVVIFLLYMIRKWIHNRLTL